MNATPSILVGTSERAVWVKVEGKGSFLNSTGLKEFAKEMTNRGYRDFVVDLATCPLMDSTFMGTLTGMSLRLRELGQGGVRIIHLNERNRDLLTNLGLDQLLTLDTPPGTVGEQPVQSVLTVGEPDKQVRAETMLAAHEDLVSADPTNQAKFKDVLEYLRQDLNILR